MNVLKIAGLILAIASLTHMINFFIQEDLVIWTVTIPPNIIAFYKLNFRLSFHLSY